MTSATDELRVLLDERGIKFKAWDGVHPITVWHDEQFSYEYMERSLLDGAKPYTGEVLDGTGFFKAVIHVCTPEQAIAATLGDATDTIENLRDSLNEVADKWAITQVNYEECAKRNTMLEALVRDMWFKNIGRMDSCGWCVIGCDDAERCELQERMAALGLFDGDAE